MNERYVAVCRRCAAGRRFRPTGLALALVASCAASWSWRCGVAADAMPPPASQTSASPAADQPAVPFQPQELSIGEPISLPNATPLQPSRTTPAPSPLPPSPGRLPAAATPPAGGSGTGWLGLAVDDTLITGRLVVVEVAADSPAATAGVRQQDVLLAINGAQVQTADEMAAALAAIAPGQRVNVAVGRDSRVDDLVLTAVARPAEARSRNWQSTAAVDATTVPPRSVLTANNAPQQPPATLPPAMQPLAAASVPAMTGPPVSLPATPPAPFGITTVPVPGDPVAGGPVPPTASVPAVSPAPLPTPAATFQPVVQSPPAVAAGLSVPAQPAPATAPQLLPRQSTAPAAHAGGRLALGVRTVPVDPAVQSRFQMADARGAYVIGVVENLPAARAGVPPGSVIVALNQQPVRSPQDLTQLVTHGPAGTPVTLEYVLPGGQARHASVVLQSLDEPLERALVGDAPGPQPVAAAPLQSAPQVARRLEPVVATRAADDGQTIVRLEATLRLMTEQLERLDRRLHQLESRR